VKEKYNVFFYIHILNFSSDPCQWRQSLTLLAVSVCAFDAKLSNRSELRCGAWLFYSALDCQGIKWTSGSGGGGREGRRTTDVVCRRQGVIDRLSLFLRASCRLRGDGRSGAHSHAMHQQQHHRNGNQEGSMDSLFFATFCPRAH
jgi:hypothetical protein